MSAGATVVRAAEAVGVSSRSVRRWRVQGQRELDRLTPEAKLVLELDRARDGAPEPDWQVPAQRLSALLAEFAEERLPGVGL
jgi:transposase-like protein